MPDITTVREHIAWSYANLARAHAALDDGAADYGRTHHIVRKKLYLGLLSGRMSMRSIFDDERLKMTLPRICVYCGSDVSLAIDHMIPRISGGADEADNLVLACRSCNSSKQGRDMLRWMVGREAFPSIYVLRRYTKIAARRCLDIDIMDEPIASISDRKLPFAVELLPHSFPPLSTLALWVRPPSTSACS